MSGFDLTELLPYYLDETDEQIGILNETLLRLEQDPADSSALKETFRVVHSLKGSASVMGFDQVNRLAHLLETLFDQLRSGSRSLDREALEICFRCLDRLRDYHRGLRAEGQGGVDLAESITAVDAYLVGGGGPEAVPRAPEVAESIAPEATGPNPGEPDEAEERGVTEDTPPPTPIGDDRRPGEADGGSAAGLAVTVVFAPTLQWRDMKARLILNRLSSRARVLGSEPPADRLEEVEGRPTFTAWVEAEADRDELRALADVDGVVEIRFGEDTAAETEAAPVSPGPTADRSVPGLAPAPAPTPASRAEPEAAEVLVSHTGRKAKVVETLRVDVERLDHLMNLAGELVISRARFTELNAGLEELFRASDARLLASDSQDRLECLLEGLEAALAQGNQGSEALERWRSQFRRLTENFRDLRSSLDRIRRGRDRLTEMTEAIDQLGRVCDDLQKGVLDTRMVPIGPLFERFRRVVRDLSVESSKEVVLMLRGESTELDKRMIDELSDPLIHMVRNAVDHGLEPPEARLAAGKPRAGTVTLAAAHRGNRVVVTVADDGRGLNVDRIRRKVVANGLLTEAEAARLSASEVIPYIFHPGLSTADAVTDISGRGVGMDVVKDRIEQLNGSVAVRTEPGRGTTFTIRLPLTLAIMPSLLIRIHEEVYALPLGEIREIVEVGPDQVLDVQGGRAIEVRGRIIALIRIDDVFRWGGGPHPIRPAPAEGEGRARRPVVIVQSTLTTVGLEVDELIGIQEIVLKSIERNYRAVRGLSGASILGNGRVALILDVDALIELSARVPAPRPVAVRGVEPEAKASRDGR